MSSLKVTQRRSGNGANSKQRATLRSLGLRRIGHTVEITDNEQARGMLSTNVVRFPFRRVNGRRHSITGRPVGLRRSA